MSNLVFRKAWQQDTDVIHNERSNEWRFFFDNLWFLLVCDLTFSPCRLIVVSPLQVNRSIDLKKISLTYGMESITWAGKDYLGLFNTRRKKSELCFVWSLIFSRVILLVGAIVDLLEVESKAGKQLFFSSLFLSARFIHFSLVGSLSRGMWRSLSLCIKY